MQEPHRRSRLNTLALKHPDRTNIALVGTLETDRKRGDRSPRTITTRFLASAWGTDASESRITETSFGAD